MMNSSSDEMAVTAEGLTVDRGGHRILDALDFRIPAGRITGLLGPSGSGKTTLLRALVGVQRLGGRATVLGLPAGDRRLRGRIGYVTQTPATYPDLTIRENVRYFAALSGGGRPGTGTSTEVDEALAAVGLADRAGSRVRELSGGQAGRVSLACALAARPELLVLDEPTVGLDPVLRTDLWRRFRGFADAGTTLLVSSHVMDEADRCDELLLLRDGRVLGHDTPDGLRAGSGRGPGASMEEVFLDLVGAAR